MEKTDLEILVAAILAAGTNASIINSDAKKSLELFQDALQRLRDGKLIVPRET